MLHRLVVLLELTDRTGNFEFYAQDNSLSFVQYK
jgi:hypothetical protein